MNKTTTPSKRGRPSKKKAISVLEINDEHDYNDACIIPSSNIKTIRKCNVKRSLECSHLPYVLSDNSDMFCQIFCILKDTGHTYVNLTFDEYGIILFNYQESSAVISVRLFNHYMKEYAVDTSVNPVSIRLETAELYKTFKNIPTKTNFAILIEGVEDGGLGVLCIKVCFDEYKSDKYYIKIQKIPSDQPKEIKVDQKQYNAIVVAESSHFANICKSTKTFSSNIIEITCNNSCFGFQWSNKKTNYIGNIIKSQFLKYIKFFENNNIIFSGKYRLESFYKYTTKLSKISNIIKFYFSTDKKIPLIIEYDIIPLRGVFQIYIDTCTINENDVEIV